MPKNVVQYNMLISCPGDVQDEVKVSRATITVVDYYFPMVALSPYNPYRKVGPRIIDVNANKKCDYSGVAEPPIPMK